MTVEDFNVERILDDLAAFGIPGRGENEGANVPFRSSVSMRMPNRGGAPAGTPELYFTDPDGLRIQVQDPTYCGGGGAALADLPAGLRAGAPSKSAPGGNAMFRLRAWRSTNWRATISSTELDALFTSMPVSCLSRLMASWLDSPSSSAIL